jgi:citronellol/citronellal dehydrogenase
MVYGDDEGLAALPLPFAPDLFKDQVVLITEAGSGIGRSAAHHFARLGARLLLCERRADRLEATATALSRYGTQAAVHPMTIRDPEATTASVDLAMQRFGGLDILVNNGGGQFPQAAIDVSPKGWNAVVDTNQRIEHSGLRPTVRGGATS